MSKILPTIGPMTEDESSLKKILSLSSLVRINGSHGNLKWHSAISKKIKNLKPDAKILLDVPGIKPRTKNKLDINIKKNEVILFYYNSNFVIRKNFFKFKRIEITNPLPKISKKSNTFTISDGQFNFKLIEYGKNYIIGKATEKFILKPKKGLNIPLSEYDESLQKKIYLKFLEKFKTVKFDAIGLSFIQNDSILKYIKKKYPNYVIVSKIENSIGLNNIYQITLNSDVIMIDRGDLSAEIGEKNLYQAIINISKISKDNGKPLIMATENLDSMMLRKSPTKSEIISLGHSLSLKSDKIMLSDETATSDNWYMIMQWLNNFILNFEKKEVLNNKKDNQILWQILDNIVDLPVVIFSKKGFALSQLAKIRDDIDLTVFTDSSKVSTLCNFRTNTNIFHIDSFDKSHLSKHIYKNIKKNKKFIFKNNNQALLIYVAYPRKNSRANTISIISIEDFK